MCLVRVDQKDLYSQTNEFDILFEVSKFTTHAGCFYWASWIKGEIQRSKRNPRRIVRSSIYLDSDLIHLIGQTQHVLRKSGALL